MNKLFFKKGVNRLYIRGNLFKFVLQENKSNIMIAKSYFIFFLSALLFLSSCSTKKKVLTSGSRSSNGSVLTDASSARGKIFSGSRLDNYASLLNVNTKKLNPQLYSFIDDWMGIPHRMGGQTKSGVDCSGFVNLLYIEVYKGNLPRTSRDMEGIVKRKKPEKLEEGDLVFFSFGKKGIDHVGVYLHNNKFVHVSTRKGVIISDLTDSWYAKTFVDAGSPKI
ncbi:C40 family peptidase [Sphingobacterium sp. BIGb0165]|uniref:C40 family peptidase n=1 Tax=Sphingobacterium sp. BIGb0165 TaxID=2940615 RepID=UPI0021670567|nr:NlpC/P60 family protein [Sphingobacterium sp. BIGb0165]MCS4228745.1 lipoprotein Spr [Sphingobacterium sp. BIGb0165]